MLSKKSNRMVAIILVLICLVTTNVRSQEQTVDAQTKEQLKVIMAHLIETLYVLPDTGKEVGAQLRSRFESGAYKDAATPQQLVTALTRDLFALSNDKHLLIRYDPASANGSDNILTLAEWETMRSSMFHSQPGSPGSGTPNPRIAEQQQRMAERAQRDNYHFRDAKYLSGNIGYLNLGGFAFGQGARDTAAKTMATLANSDAMIIDLRSCPGGSPEMVIFLASYFFDKEPRVLMNRYIRPTGQTIQSKTVADIPGKRMPDIDLYLLVGAGTFSACESFPYTLQQYGRAKVVGERTPGGGHNNTFIPLGKGYVFSVSYGRPIHPISGKGWEGEGVQPDIAVKAENALETAHRDALQKLINKTTDENRKKALMSALQSVSPQSKPQAETLNRNAADDSAIVKELNTYLENAAASDAFSGAVILAKNDQPIFTKAYGLANKAANSSNKTDTKFNLGSLNKMFTAVAIAQLAERGKLSFIDTVGKLVPDYPNKAVAEKVTIHQLLTHTSGMGDYDYGNAKVNKTAAELLPLFVNTQLAFEPGAKWQYSNAGYALLGAIIEKVSRQNYYDYVREHIFKPTGMVNTDSYERGTSVPNLAIGYTKANDAGRADPSLPRRENTPPAKGSPAGGGYSTVEDLLKFSAALRGHKLLDQKYTEILMTGKVEVGPPVGKYAYGFSDKIFEGKHIVGHNGGSPGIGANFDIFPELGYTAIVLTNYDASAMMPLIMKFRGVVAEKR